MTAAVEGVVLAGDPGAPARVTTWRDAEPDTAFMMIAPRYRTVVVSGFALSLMLGLALTPTPPNDEPAAWVTVFRDQTTLVNVAGLFRALAAILALPALIVLAPAFASRGRRCYKGAATALAVASLAGLVTVTQVILQNLAIAGLPDTTAAVALTAAVQSSPLWLISSVTYLLGMLIGFLLLGASVWLAGFSRWSAIAIGLGLPVHISVADWWATSAGGMVILAAGLIALGRQVTVPAPSDPPVQPPVSGIPESGRAVH